MNAMHDCHTKLLLVEDNDLDVIMLQMLMRRLALDYPIIRAKNGEEALEILRPRNGGEPTLHPPFIIFLDINMPRMDGFELLDKLGDNDALVDIPIYIVSTSSRQCDIDRAMQYKVDGYVVKPITEQLLLHMLGHTATCPAPATGSTPASDLPATEQIQHPEPDNSL